MGLSIPHRFKKFGKWLFLHRERLLLLLGMFLVGGLSFEAGMLHGTLGQARPIQISIPEVPAVAGQTSGSSGKPVTSAGLQPIVAQIGRDAVQMKGCAFVGSRNSNKYHLPTCAVSKIIKPENIVCFASKEDAEKRGYVGGCLK